MRQFAKAPSRRKNVSREEVFEAVRWGKNWEVLTQCNDREAVRGGRSENGAFEGRAIPGQVGSGRKQGGYELIFTNSSQAIKKKRQGEVVVSAICGGGFVLLGETRVAESGGTQIRSARCRGIGKAVQAARAPCEKEIRLFSPVKREEVRNSIERGRGPDFGQYGIIKETIDPETNSVAALRKGTRSTVFHMREIQHSSSGEGKRWLVRGGSSTSQLEM